MRWALLLAVGCVALVVGCCQLPHGELMFATAPLEALPGADLPPLPAPADGRGEAGGGDGAGGAEAAFELASKALPSVAVGTVIGKGPPEGWSDLVVFATPTLTAEDLRDAPKVATHYAQLFKFVVLARTAKAPGQATYRLDAVGRGFATTIRDRETVISSRDTRGADMGLFGQRILSENERILDEDVRQVVRGDTFLVFDAKSTMRVGTDHVRRVMRHALVVNPDTGKLTTFVWLLTPDGPGLRASEKEIQQLPPSFFEPRLLSVKRDRFVLGLPTPDAFALVRIPQGKPIPYTDDLRAAATVARFDATRARALEAALRKHARP